MFGAHGTVLTVPLDDLPDWLPVWCVDQLGDEPVSVLFAVRQMSAVFGLRLAGGQDVVVKVREDLPAIPGATPTSSFASSDLSKLTDQSIWPVSKRLSCTKRRPFRFECCDYRNK